MIPENFDQANAIFRPPSDLTHQCGAILAFKSVIETGSLEGSPLVVTAWKPSDLELAAILRGKPIFVSFLGGLPPHFVTTDFHAATHPE